jgi:hypothetical protein
MSLVLGAGLTDRELEKLRLLLSVFQDGIGMLSTEDHTDLFFEITRRRRGKRRIVPDTHDHQPRMPLFLNELGQPYTMEERTQGTLPGWRDFERAVALAFNGVAFESKAIVDVVLPLGDGTFYGVSCKSRGELDKATVAGGRVYIEVSNAAGGFWDQVLSRGITSENLHEPEKAQITGESLFELIETWHEEVSIANGGSVDLAKSSYLILLYNGRGVYKLYQFALKFPNAQELNWSVPLRTFKDVNKPPVRRRCLVAKDKTGESLIEWYLNSGGQLKYYPLASDAVWSSREFTLEPLPPGTKHGVLSRVEEYFPELWKKVNEDE